MNFKNLKDLRNHLKTKIKKALVGEVFETVKKVQLEHVRTDVHDAYNPSIYERRMFDGISDPDNIKCHVKDTKIEIENITEFNPDYGTENYGSGLVKLIEYGHGKIGYYYDYPGSDDYTDSRPFIHNTYKDLKENKQHILVLKSELKKQGMKIK